MPPSGGRNKTNSPWTPAVLAEASRLWREGVTAQEIANRMGGIFTRGALIDKARRNRDKFPEKENEGRARQILDFPLEQAAKLWKLGKSSREIGRELGYKAAFVRGKAARNRELFPPREAGGYHRENQKPRDAALQKEAGNVQRMPLPSSGTWKPIELDDYELARLPGVSMADNTGCKYPLTDTGPHCFCAAPKFQMKPYCAYHVVKCNPPGAGTGSEKRAHKMK